MEKNYLKPDFRIDSYSDISLYVEELLSREVSSPEDLKKLILDYGSLVEVIEEHFGWAYINMTRDTQNKDYKERFSFFNDEIMPKVQKDAFELNKKITESAFSSALEDSNFKLYVKKLKVHVDIFREANIPLSTEVSNLSASYQEKIGSLMVSFRGKEYTQSQMVVFFESKDRNTRKEAYEAVIEKRMSIKKDLDEIFSKMLSLRHKMALNAGFQSYTDFKFKEMERFDYTVKDCEEFHLSVRDVWTPIFGKIVEDKKKLLGISSIMPYDSSATMPDDEQLKPFEDESDFINKSKLVFSSIDKRFADVFDSVHKAEKLDLTSRKGKAPGGYNYPLYKSGLPFIFMNASGTNSDMRTLMHETGHAVHTVAVKDMFTYFYKSTSSEIAELASMGMEMITFDRWNFFYPDKNQLKQAQRKHLEGIISFFPWCAIVDKFQHYLYANPKASVTERDIYFENLALEYQEKFFDWSPYKDYLKTMWHKQIHIFEVPFYYIEYGMAQLGALQLWKNYMDNPKKTIEMYLAGLSLGSSKTISEVYSSMGVSFDFSKANMENLMDFVLSEYRKVCS